MHYLILVASDIGDDDDDDDIHLTVVDIHR